MSNADHRGIFDWLRDLLFLLIYLPVMAWKYAPRLTLVIGALAAAVVVLLFAGCSDGARDNEAQFKPKEPFIQVIRTTGSSMQGVLDDSGIRQIDFAFRYDDLAKGDIVLFWDYKREGYTLHEIVDQQGSLWITQGSNPETNRRADAPFLFRDNYVGKYVGRRLDQ